MVLGACGSTATPTAELVESSTNAAVTSSTTRSATTMAATTTVTTRSTSATTTLATTTTSTAPRTTTTRRLLLSEAFCNDLEAGYTPMQIYGGVKDKYTPKEFADLAFGMAAISCPDQLASNDPLRQFLINWNIDPDDR